MESNMSTLFFLIASFGCFTWEISVIQILKLTQLNPHSSIYNIIRKYLDLKCFSGFFSPFCRVSRADLRYEKPEPGVINVPIY